ncbi:hypothetical protein chiPu_0010458 [Chiloscyllium punctatum]|uniref:Uncharacterized protein n=1 Tax=Chiloscyllium punctatum TaxID=137246 RepID=A0A401SNN5_CHIPU|nr:hypothetical protein [Chiloscyllium punctatum]
MSRQLFSEIVRAAIRHKDCKECLAVAGGVRSVTATSPHGKQVFSNFDLGSKYFKQRQDSIPLRGLSAHSIFNSGTQMAKPGHLPPASTYFCEQELEPS